MIKMTYIDGLAQLQAFCDVCEQRLDSTGVYAWERNRQGRPVTGEIKHFHAGDCATQGTQAGKWTIEPLGTLPTVLIAGLSVEPDREKARRARIRAAILRTVVKYGERGATVRDLENMHNSYTADEIMIALQYHIANGLIKVAPELSRRKTTRYIAPPEIRDTNVLVEA